MATTTARKITSTFQKGVKYIGTHHGSFHCDEALAVSLLQLLPAFSSHSVLRTRDPALLAECDIVVDVGGEYDPLTKRFDHHQKSFTTTFPGSSTKLSSAGLVYLHYGKEIIKSIWPADSTSDDDKVVSLIYEKIYKGFIEHIDGIDNGVSVNEEGTPLRYNVSSTLSNRVGYLNPAWNQDSSVEKVNEQFEKAMALTISEFLERVTSLTTVWLPARSIVLDVLNCHRESVHASGEIIVLKQYCPWKSHLYMLERELGISGKVKFVLYEDTTGNMWRIQAVNEEDQSFALRLGMPESWRGLRDDELSAAAGIEQCTFCHAGGFIGGNKTYDGALEMAIKALELSATKRQKTE